MDSHGLKGAMWRWFRWALWAVGFILGVVQDGHAQQGEASNLATWYTKKEVEKLVLPPEKFKVAISRDAYEKVLASGEYLVGPGDEFVIVAEGELSGTYEAVVLAGGELLIRDVGMIRVAGLRLREAADAIRARFEELFQGVRVRVSLTNLRRFKVAVSGEVRSPGAYSTTAVDMALDVMRMAGGLIPPGQRGAEGTVGSVHGSSLRNIQVKHRDGTVARVDLIRYALTGDSKYNPYICDGDAIYVPVRGPTVAVSGAVNAPGDYELVQGERLSDLVLLAKGLAEGADVRRAELVRFNEDHVSTSIVPVDLKSALKGDAEADLRLEADDQLFVRFVPKWHPRRRVAITGEVNYPGEYTINEGEDTLVDLVRKAGGFTKEASLADAIVLRTVSTATADPEFERLKTMDVSDMTEDEYEYFKMKARERAGLMVVDFIKLFEQRDLSGNIFLQPGDIVDIPRLKQTVTVSGQVANPGGVLYDPSYGIRDYIAKVGGYGWNARVGRTRVIKGRTGEWLNADEVKRIDPGDTIWVPENPHRDWWELFIEIMTVAGQASTIYLLLSSIGK